LKEEWKELAAELREKHCREMLAGAIEKNYLRRTHNDLSDDILAALEERFAHPCSFQNRNKGAY